MRRFVALFALLCVLLMPAAPAQQTPSSTPASQAAPSKSPTSQESVAQGNPDIKVWVNMKSGIYHCPGSHWYGATKVGAYMKQSEAQQKGFRPAYHRVCK